ncbi:MAG: competence/damage-inducible protein A [Candidatus Omnitrophota bacterium]
MRRGKTVSVELVSVGSELLRGEQKDDNSPYLLRELSKIGFSVKQVTVVPDFPFPPLVKTLRNALRRTTLLVVSGGLGPTDDDLTRQAVGRSLRKRLVFSPCLCEEIRKRFQKRGMVMPKINERQAYLPQGARALPNPVGTAPGILLEIRNKILIALPGVPQELHAIFQESALPYLKRCFPRLAEKQSVTLKTTGLPESRINELLAPLIRKEKQISFGFYAHPGEVDIRLSAASSGPRARTVLQRTERAVRRRLGGFLFGTDEETLEGVVFRLLEKRKKTVSVGESCTGGMLSGSLTRLPGSSRHFKMGVVAYSNEAKRSLLGVPEKLLLEHGAVSEPVAKALARQARHRGKTDFGLGVSGILGPGGGTKKKPVGLAYLALATPTTCIAEKHLFHGTREMRRIRVVKASLDLLRRELK